jgi:class 3 adenylate cyclase/predicted ATPase
MRCPSCMAENAATRRFCAQCGAPLPSLCPACGFENEPIAKFCGGCGKPIGEVAAPTPAEVSTAPRTDSAERRQLTVMFCDLVGSTALASQLDPEDLREVIGAYHKCVADTISRYDGFVAKYMGDGVLAYFGYPQAHEDDAERAVRAGLSVIDTVHRLDVKFVNLQARVGIATGLVIVGDLIGEGSAQEQSVVGETPNLAARLQVLAEPETVVIAAGTRRLVGDLFEYRELGMVEVKGIARPVPAWQVLRPSGIVSRFEALHGSALSPLVGRDEEIDLLLRRWARAKTDEGQVVLVYGEPGIGKSRITATVEERIEAEPHIRVRYFCSPYHQDSALFPFIAQLERAAGFAREDTVPTRLEKLQTLAAANEDRDVPVLAELLSLPFDSRYPTLDLSPQRKKEKTFEALLRQLSRLASQQPVLMVFEDLHWVDPTSQELLDLIIERIEEMPVLLIATFRPELQSSWTGQPHVTTLSLRRLKRDESDQLVRGIIGNAAPFSREVLEQIVARTNGVPLFLEELTKAVLETAVYGTGDGERFGRPVPATLQASLMARLDRIGATAKEVAQLGAAIGREFSYGLLAETSRCTEAEVQEALGSLVQAGLLFQRGAPPEATFVFKHALVQDTAYGSLLRGPRQSIHARIADALLSIAGEGRPIRPQIIAHHLQSAGRPVEAIGYWSEAGEQAVRRAANREAIGHFRRGLSLLEGQQATADRWRSELAILSRLGPSLMSVHGWSAPEVGDAVERAAEVGRRLDSSADVAPALANLWRFNLAQGRFDRADAISTDLFKIAHEVGDAEILLQAHHTAWPTCRHRGLLTEAGKLIDTGLALYDEDRHAHHRYVYLGHDPGVCALDTAATVQWALGYSDKAARLEGEAMSLARRLQHAPSLAHALWRVCDFRAARGDIAAVTTAANELLELSEEHGLHQHRANALIFLGWALARSGEITTGLECLDKGLGFVTKIGSQDTMTLYLCLVAEGHLLAQQFVKGLEQVSRGLALASETGEQCWVSPLYRLRGQLLLCASRSSEGGGEENLLHSITVAQQQKAKGLELQATTHLASLWREQGRSSEARDLLAPIYGWFTEGFDTPDLKEAKALLGELG